MIKDKGKEVEDFKEVETEHKGTCFKCREGHRAFDCTNFRKNIRGGSKKNLACEEFFETHNGPKNGDNLILRRISLIEVDEELVLRSFFKTKCKITRKCCKVIIDSGSSTKLASQELVKKL